MALGFDGDGDRCGVVDNEGEEIFADKVGVMLARDISAQHQGATFVADVKSTGLFMTDPVLHANGAKTDYWKTGHSYMKRRVNEIGAVAGFEKSGHFFFNKPLGRGYDDGLIFALAVCDMLDRNPGKSMADLKNALPKTWSSPTMSPHCADEIKYRVVDDVVKHFEPAKEKGEKVAGQPIRDLVTVNGVRVTVEDGTWGLVRASSNKPELVVVVESPVSEARMRDMFKAVDAVLRTHPGGRRIQPDDLNFSSRAERTAHAHRDPRCRTGRALPRLSLQTSPPESKSASSSRTRRTRPWLRCRFLRPRAGASCGTTTRDRRRVAPALETWNDITIEHRDERIVVDGIGFAAIGRLRAPPLSSRRVPARSASRRRYQRVDHHLDELDEFDLVVGADGVNSLVRRTHSRRFGRPPTSPTTWPGSARRRPFTTLTQTFRASEFGNFNAHHYRYASDRSTFIVEVDEATFRRIGFDSVRKCTARSICEDVFADTLDGHPLISNRSIWRQFPIINNRRWCARATRDPRRRASHRAFLDRLGHATRDGRRDCARCRARAAPQARCR